MSNVILNIYIIFNQRVHELGLVPLGSDLTLTANGWIMLKHALLQALTTPISVKPSTMITEAVLQTSSDH